jgi:hypothetical protein
MRGKGTARVILVTVAVRRGGMLGAPVLRGAVHDLGRPRRREVFSFDDLQKAPKKTTGWDNVRNGIATRVSGCSAHRSIARCWLHEMHVATLGNRPPGPLTLEPALRRALADTSR